MSEAVQFQDAYFRDGILPMGLEDSIRRTSVFAGIMDFDFQNAISESFNDLTNWDDQDGAATWDVSAGQLDATGGGAAQWYQIRHEVEVAPSFVASFDVVSGNSGAFIFCGRDSATWSCFMAWWTTGAVGIARYTGTGVAESVVNMPYGITGPARVQVAVRYSLDSIDDDRKWLLASMFVDGQCYVGSAFDIGGTSWDWDGNHVGFAVFQSNNTVIDNFTISDVCRIVDWTSIDQGETAATGQARAIATTRLARMVRYDGKLRVWRPTDRDLDWAVGDDRTIQLMDRRNLTKVVSHVRAQGAIHEMDVFDDTEGEVHGHRFAIRNDPNLMTKDGARAEAWRVLHDNKEEQEVIRFVMPPNVLLEPHDRISWNGVDYRILSIVRNLTMTQRGPQYQSTVEARRYLPLGTPPDRS
jgi:hypothetical protein